MVLRRSAVSKCSDLNIKDVWDASLLIRYSVSHEQKNVIYCHELETGWDFHIFILLKKIKCIFCQILLANDDYYNSSHTLTEIYFHALLKHKVFHTNLRWTQTSHQWDKVGIFLILVVVEKRFVWQFPV